MKSRLSSTLLIVVVLIMVVVGILLTWGIALDLDKDAKANLIAQAEIVANSISTERLKNLSGVKSDADLPDYLRIKEQLYKIRVANKACQFLYILGYDESKKNVFFYVDSQLPDSEDYAEPGLVYDEVTEEVENAIRAEIVTFVGPITDRWGTLVTALVPIKDPVTNELIATLGMDVEANDWYNYLVKLSMLPVGMTLLATLLIVLTILLKWKTRELSKIVRVDALTNLYSRKIILEHAEMELNKSMRTGCGFSIIILDLDNFKKINDRYGHQVGDMVLREIALCFKRTVRKTDMVGRIGGEEFIVLLPSTNEEEAVKIAEKLRRAIETLEFDCSKYQGLSAVSASFGVSSMKKDMAGFESLYELADKALYLSKNDGKNKVSICSA